MQGCRVPVSGEHWRAWCFVVVLLACVSGSSGAQEIERLLADSLAPGWVPAEPVRSFEGEDLFRMIDGGAPLFFEYGFRRAVARSYNDPDGRAIEVEIYEMAGSAAAFGLFSFQRAGDLRPVPLGDEGTEGPYHTSFWKGDFVVTVTSSDSSSGARGASKALAAFLAGCLRGSGRRPQLAFLAGRLGVPCSAPVYLRGPLALMNQFDFGIHDLFRVKEGIALTAGGGRLFVFQYRDESECEERLQAALLGLRGQPRYARVKSEGTEASGKLTSGEWLRVAADGSYAIVVLAAGSRAGRELLSSAHRALEGAPSGGVRHK